MKPAPEEPDVPPEVRRHIDRSIPAFPGMPWRRRLFFVGLALAMGWTVVSTIVDPPGGFKRNPPPRPDAAACGPGQTQGCVGGTAQIIAAPAAPVAPAASR